MTDRSVETIITSDRPFDVQCFDRSARSLFYILQYGLFAQLYQNDRPFLLCHVKWSARFISENNSLVCVLNFNIWQTYQIIFFSMIRKVSFATLCSVIFYVGMWQWQLSDLIPFIYHPTKITFIFNLNDIKAKPAQL